MAAEGDCDRSNGWNNTVLLGRFNYEKALAAARDRLMEQSCRHMQWPDLDLREGAQTN